MIAPVARYAGPWHIPVLTAGAQAEAFGYKHPSYLTLTRMMGSYTQAGVAIRKVFEVILTDILLVILCIRCCTVLIVDLLLS